MSCTILTYFHTSSCHCWLPKAADFQMKAQICPQYVFKFLYFFLVYKIIEETWMRHIVCILHSSTVVNTIKQYFLLYVCVSAESYFSDCLVGVTTPSFSSTRTVWVAAKESKQHKNWKLSLHCHNISHKRSNVYFLVEKKENVSCKHLTSQSMECFAVFFFVWCL